MQFYMAADERSHSLPELRYSGKFITPAEYRHPYQKEGASKVTVVGALNHIEGGKTSVSIFLHHSDANKGHPSSV